MTMNHVEFSVSPWLLLLILPALALIALVFFIGRKKRSRCTANRIISAALQSVVAVLCIFALSGIGIVHEEPSPQSELVILVDRSFTSERARAAMDEFVGEILQENEEAAHCETAVILFGKEQKIALPMGSYSAEEAYSRYLAASEEAFDGSATDLSSALLLAWDPAVQQGVIRDPSSAKALILSDGLQTDRDALATVRGLIRDGVRIDTSFYAETAHDDVCLVDVAFPANELCDNRTFDLEVTLYSSRAKEATLSLSDTDERGEEQLLPPAQVSLKRGLQTVSLSYSFGTPGFHCLEVRSEGEDDVPENNVYYVYYDVKESTYMLILEKYAGESESVAATVADSSALKDATVETRTVGEMQSATAEELAKYNEIVLYNIAAGDMTESFQNALSSYAFDYGGGVFTVGGFEKEDGKVVTQPKERNPEETEPVRHSYRDEGESAYASMLPVSIEDYQPAIAVVYVFDVSSSMTGITGAPIYTAVEDVRNSLKFLNKRDYVGIVALEKEYQQVAPLLPMTQRETIEEKIGEMEKTTNWETDYAPALQQAVRMLSTCPDNVAVKHIVLLSDGGDGKLENYGYIIRDANKAQGITITVMTYYKSVRYFDGDPNPYYFYHSYDVKGSEIKKDSLDALAAYGQGTSVFALRTAYHAMESAFVKDLHLEELEEVGTQSFHPRIGRNSEALGDVTNTELSELTLGGFFPSRLKTDGDAEVVLYAESSPLYAEWSFGAGRVGSLMIDLEGYWSGDLLEKETGQRLVGNLAANLFRRVAEPAAGTLSFTLSEDNFRTQVNVYGFNADKEPDAKIVAFVEAPDSSVLKCDFTLSATHNRFEFDNSLTGTYTVYVLKVDADLDFMDERYRCAEDLPASAVRETLTGYRTFSYSKEYDDMADAYSTGQSLLAALSTRKTEEGAQAYEKFVYDAETVLADRSYTRTEIALRRPLIIAAIALYLVGIALRRFKLPSLSKKERTN